MSNTELAIGTTDLFSPINPPWMVSPLKCSRNFQALCRIIRDKRSVPDRVLTWLLNYFHKAYPASPPAPGVHLPARWMVFSVRGRMFLRPRGRCDSGKRDTLTCACLAHLVTYNLCSVIGRDCMLFVTLHITSVGQPLCYLDAVILASSKSNVYVGGRLLCRVREAKVRIWSASASI